MGLAWDDGDPSIFTWVVNEIRRTTESGDPPSMVLLPEADYDALVEELTGQHNEDSTAGHFLGVPVLRSMGSEKKVMRQ